MKNILFLLLLCLFFNGTNVHSLESQDHAKRIHDGIRKPPKRVFFSKKKRAKAEKIQHLIVIMQENWSFDGLFGKFPKARGICKAKERAREQVNLFGTPFRFLVPCVDTRTGMVYPQIPQKLPNGPFNLQPYIPMDQLTGKLTHLFYNEQNQINGGFMNRFATYNEAGGLAMSYYDVTRTRMGALAKKYVLCDNWFHSCYGGSMCGALWLFSGQMPVWPNADPVVVSILDPSGVVVEENLASPDGFAINDAQPFFPPFKAGTPDNLRVPPQNYQTIGDLLSAKGISWKWYAQGWNDAVSGNPDPTFPFHHQAPVYFSQFAPGTQMRADHLFDLDQLYVDLNNGQLPAVSFIRSLDEFSLHPALGTVTEGIDWVADLIQAIQSSSAWDSCAIILTFDESGGRWDHVTPPIVDVFGPSVRVPTIIISPFAKRKYIDHTSYETVSVLKFIEQRWKLPALSTRDAQANNILKAFDFD